VQCSAVQCSAVQCSAVQCSTVQCSAVQCSVVHLMRACPGRQGEGGRGEEARALGIDIHYTGDTIHCIYTRLPTIGHLAKKKSELTQDSVAMLPRGLPGFFIFHFLVGKWWWMDFL
jgi:hypothetical protein